MEYSVQIPSDALERRRLQNRIAQRKFRQKRQLTTTAPHHASVKNATGRVEDHAVDDINGFTSITTETIDPRENPRDESHNNNHRPNESTPENINSGEWEIDLDLMNNMLFDNPTQLTAPHDSSFLPLPSSTYTETHQPHYSNPTIPSNYASPTPQPPELANIVPAPTQDTSWLSALHIAARTGNVKILTLLLLQALDPNEKDSDGRTPLHYAVIENHNPIVTLLLAHGARIKEVDCDQRSALHWAVILRREKILEELLARREEQVVDVNAYDFSGWTPVHMAVYAKFERGVEMLLECGANIGIKARRCPHADVQVEGLLTRRSV